MANGLVEHFRMLALYNRRANERLYDACASLDDAGRRQDRRGFFGSIHGTLNHIMVGDRIWIARFEGATAPSDGLDAILYDDFDDLRAARVTEDSRIEAFMDDSLDGDLLAGTLHYVNYAGHAFDESLALLVAHFFNHQTHHRGQVHDMLSQAGVAAPVLDMHRVINPDPD